MAHMAAYTREQQMKAQAAAANADRWAEGVRLSDGLRYVVFASETTPNVYYQTHIVGLGCSCPRGQRNQRCWHQLAASLAAEKAQAPKPRRRYEDMDWGLEDSF